jgi:hypothetical protein
MEKNDVGFAELAGLQYFNKGVRLNNASLFNRAFKAMVFAEIFYPSARIVAERAIVEQNLITSAVASSSR